MSTYSMAIVVGLTISASVSAESVMACTSGGASCTEEQDNVEMLQAFRRGSSLEAQNKRKVSGCKCDAVNVHDLGNQLLNFVRDFRGSGGKCCFDALKKLLEAEQTELQTDVDKLKAKLEEAKDDEEAQRKETQDETKRLNAKITKVMEDKEREVARINAENKHMEDETDKLLKEAEELLQDIASAFNADVSEVPSLLQATSQRWGWAKNVLKKVGDGIKAVKDHVVGPSQQEWEDMQQEINDEMKRLRSHMQALQTDLEGSNATSKRLKQDIVNVEKNLASIKESSEKEINALTIVSENLKKIKGDVFPLVLELRALKKQVQEFHADMEDKAEKLQAQLKGVSDRLQEHKDSTEE